MFCHVLWGQTGVSLLIRVCHLLKITFMFCHALWGQTGVSLLIRVCHLSKITFMFCHVMGGQMGVSFVKNHIYVLSCNGGTDGGVICQKSHLCFVMYWGDRWGCHLSKITLCFVMYWGDRRVGSLLIRVCHLSKKSHSCIIRELTFVWFQLKVSPVTLVTCSDNTTGDDYIFKQLSPC